MFFNAPSQPFRINHRWARQERPAEARTEVRLRLSNTRFGPGKFTGVTVDKVVHRLLT